MLLNPDKCFLDYYLCEDSPQIVRDEQIKNSPAEKDLRLLLDEKLNMAQQRVLAAQKANCILGCIQSSIGQQVKGGNFVPPLCYGETPLASSSGALNRKNMALLEPLQRRAYLDD
ncbi:hypothetical protein WISP_105315 [Willisornis vidua]|uniref:Uncharacterized protein n=1 Tax=Willisornis vidua TaxID=1566151 RepID=A0ABQ9D3A8_9PASS|nr:hypothetical protein WISP_105315 [Willisornis vidua]